jgi:hypothetical protein
MKRDVRDARDNAHQELIERGLFDRFPGDSHRRAGSRGRYRTPKYDGYCNGDEQSNNRNGRYVPNPVTDDL